MESLAAVETFDWEVELWPRVARGDLEAADELARTTYRAVYASLFRLCGGDEDLAADLTQETYRKAWRSIDRFRGGSKFSTWLYRIAYNTFLNHIRRPKLMEPLTEERADRLLDPGRTAQEETFLSLEARRLRAAILDLPDELRFAVTARFWAELPLAEIAQLLGISTVGVRKRLQRAYGQLAAALEGETQ
jgi:RNA polymerase sigma-70 factor (ECF subfamily)